MTGAALGVGAVIIPVPSGVARALANRATPRGGHPIR